jgi:molybdate transport system ATP-binding protein
MTAPQALHIRLKLDRAEFSLDVDMSLPGGGISVLFGPSGSGKTTLLRCIAGLEPAATGLVQIGEDCWQSSEIGVMLPPHRRNMGYVFQEASLFEHLDVRGNIEFGFKRNTVGRTPGLLNDAIDLLGIGHLLHRPVSGLSGGERQRVAIARALATRPQLLLLDEPMAALDPARKLEVFPWLERLRDELRIPMIYVTHSMDELTRLGDHLVVLDQGRIRAQGPMSQTLSRMDARLIEGQDIGVLLEGQVAAIETEWHLAKVAFDGGHLWVRSDDMRLGKTVRLRVQARDISIATQEPAKTSIQNHVPAEIVDAMPDTHPSQMLVHLRFGSHLLVARITRRAWSQLSLEKGRTVWAQLKTVAVVH